MNYIIYISQGMKFPKSWPRFEKINNWGGKKSKISIGLQTVDKEKLNLKNIESESADWSA